MEHTELLKRLYYGDGAGAGASASRLYTVAKAENRNVTYTQVVQFLRSLSNCPAQVSKPVNKPQPTAYDDDLAKFRVVNLWQRTLVNMVWWQRQDLLMECLYCAFVIDKKLLNKFDLACEKYGQRNAARIEAEVKKLSKKNLIQVKKYLRRLIFSNNLLMFFNISVKLILLWSDDDIQIMILKLLDFN